MSELEDILNYLETTSLEPHDDYVSEFSYKDQKTLWKYIKELQQENQELKNSLEQKIKELNEENIQCSKYAIEINDLKEKLEEYKEIGKDINVSTKGAKNDN